MTKRSSLFVSALSVFLLGADGTHRGQTVEKQPFPPASPRVFDVDLPTIHRALDALPEEAGLQRIYAINSQLSSVQRWQHLLSSDGVDVSDYQYIGPPAKGNAEAILLGLTDGRVTRIGYFYPYLPHSKVVALAAPFATVGTDATASERNFSVVVNDTKIVGDLAGNENNPTLFEVAFDPASWAKLNEKVADNVAEASRLIIEISQNLPQRGPTSRPNASSKGRPIVLSGAMWVSRNSGSSDLLRGQKIWLLPSELSPALVATALREDAVEWRDECSVDDARLHEAQTRVIADKTSGAAPGSWDSIIAESEMASLSDVQNIRSILTTVQSLHGPTDTDVAYKMVKSHASHTTPFLAAAQAYGEANCYSGADAKYSVNIDQPGRYYLYSSLDTKSIFIDWLVPVDIDCTHDVHIDLFNDNASTVNNF